VTAAADQFATFRLDRLLFGVPVLKVREVIRFQPLTPVPLAPPTVRGLLNLRGDIVPALDLRRRLGMAPRAQESAAMNLVIAHEHELVSFLVDEIGDVVQVEESVLEAVPDHLPAAVREVLVGIYKLRGELLLALDPVRTAALGGQSGAGAERPAAAEDETE
jgi:purine-binding chemotaxis protein CheW